MNKVAKENLKIDLHIHSYHSHESENSNSDVLNNTIDKLPLLVSKLECEGVSIASITDHNRFNQKMYDRLSVLVADSKIVKLVLPGVEFDLLYNGVHIHVVAIFNNNDDTKLKKLETELLKYRGNKLFSEMEFREILINTQLSVLLIPHQKDRIENPRDRDLSTMGIENFVNSISFFDAVEFKSFKVEPYIRKFQHENSTYFTYLTGSDCHSWEHYPKYDSASTEGDSLSTYIRALPTYKGLVMSLTEATRISLEKETLDDPFIESLHIGGQEIPLSQRLNVIIGDNSTGKSALLHLLADKTGYSDLPGFKRDLEGIYDDFGRDKLRFTTRMNKEQIGLTSFRPQGSIRDLFQKNEMLVNNEIIQEYFNDFNQDEEIKKLLAYSDKYVTKIEHNDKISGIEKWLERKIIKVPKAINSEYFPKLKTIAITTEKSKLAKHNRIIRNIGNAIIELEKLEKDIYYEEWVGIQTILASLNTLKKKYVDIRDNQDFVIQYISLSNETLKIVDNDIKSLRSTTDEKISEFETDIDLTLEKYLEYWEELSIVKPFKIQQLQYPENVNPIGEFNFYNQPKKLEYSIDDIHKILDNGFLGKKGSKDNLELNLKEFKEKIGYLGNDNVSVNDHFKSKIEKSLKDDWFAMNTTIMYRDYEKTSNKSAGSNALIYLELLAYSQGHYLIMLDQPEDDVAQAKISTKLIDILRKMSKTKQVIIVTHNPQLVVNLDVDNVICLKNTNGLITTTSGALEYFDNEVNILSDVAKILDGGAETIMRRWKIYDKTENQQS